MPYGKEQAIKKEGNLSLTVVDATLYRTGNIEHSFKDMKPVCLLASDTGLSWESSVATVEGERAVWKKQIDVEVKSFND
jgi:hypothetical protein